MILFLPLLIALSSPQLKPLAAERQLLISGPKDSVDRQLKLFSTVQTKVDERDLKIRLVQQDKSFNKKYDVPSGQFILILVGKDGMEKFRSAEVTLPEKIFSIIDAMPMRKREMNSGKKML